MSIGIHKIKVYKAESAVSASIGLHRLTQKETLGETLGRPLVNCIIMLVNLVNQLVNDDNKKDPPAVMTDGFSLSQHFFQFQIGDPIRSVQLDGVTRMHMVTAAEILGDSGRCLTIH